jgi:predicted acetylornithine/succinylornithine family transaminase
VALASLQELERDAVMGTYARQPVEFVRGEGTRLWDDRGNEYLDFLCGISVSLLGHCHPGVVEAVREQAGRLIHVGNLFYTEPPMRLAARLSELSLGGKVFFTNSGAEAIECALKLARKRRAGGEFVVLERGFHGRTYGALSATPQEAKQAPFAPLVPGFRAVPPDNPEALLAAIDEQTAAVIVEAVQGEGGIHPLESGLLEAARAACDEHGALLICDEVQCGLGRTGALWGFQHAGIEPDLMTLAKGLGGGLPIGACVASAAVSDVLGVGDHGSTFAGGPVVAAAANAVLDAVDEVRPGVRAKGERLRLGLERLGLEVRGIGLMLAFRTADGPGLVARALAEQRLVLNATGPDTVRLLPPLNVSDADIDEVVSRIATLL